MLGIYASDPYWGTAGLYDLLKCVSNARRQVVERNMVDQQQEQEQEKTRTVETETTSTETKQQPSQPDQGDDQGSDDSSSSED